MFPALVSLVLLLLLWLLLTQLFYVIITSFYSTWSDGNQNIDPPIRSRLNTMRGTLLCTRNGRAANGCTCNEVPIIITISTSCVSCNNTSKKRYGNASPKNTTSGFTTPPHEWQYETLPSMAYILFLLTSYGKWHTVHDAELNEPWASTSNSAGTPAARYRPSMFCVQHRNKRPSSLSSLTK